MTVFIAHAPQDKETAEALEKFLERRGQFVELEDGEGAFRPLQLMDVVVALVSKDSVFSPYRLRFDQRALEAWAEQKLIVVKLDHNFAPVGLRDLPFVDASFEAQREFTWGKVATQISEIGQLQRRGPAAAAPAPQAQEQSQDGAGGSPQAPPARARLGRKRREGFRFPWGFFLALAFILPGLGAGAVIGAIWLANRIGPRPGTLLETWEGVDAFGVRLGLPDGLGAPIALALVAIAVFTLLVVLIRWIVSLFGGRRAGAGAESREAAPEAEADESDAVFVSYARANSKLVLPVVEAVKKQGRKLWLDKENLGAGDGWAGEIVRAIRTAEGVCVMCSAAAFESDHVKREVYLADRYKKRLVPVFIEDAAPPEDFEYFFAGVQQLRLFETPEAERADALGRALGAAA